jgi:hypothetical protein
MKQIIPLTLKFLGFCVWIIIDQVMRVITSPKSIITAESMNNRGRYRNECVNERNAQNLNEELKEL